MSFTLDRLARSLPPSVRAASVLAALATPTLAQTWVPLSADGPQQPGLPAQVVLDAAQSTAALTTINVTIFGFWRENVTGEDGKVYQRLTFPGLEHIEQVGAPDLPAVRVNIAGGSSLGQLKLTGVNVLDTVAFEGLLPLPTFVPGEDEDYDPTADPGPGDTKGSDPQWAFDSAIYGGNQAWPLVSAEPSPVATKMLGPIKGATATAYPVTYNPGFGLVTVKRSFSFTYKSVGTGQPLTVTKLHDKQAQAHFINWQSSKTFWPLNPVQYHSRYLIVAQSMWWDTLTPFVNHKKAQGFQVSMVQVAPDVDAIRTTIANWYNLGDPGMDHYCLLIGDTNWVPSVLIFEPGVAVYSDDPYGCVGPLDTSKEVYVGRISADNEDSLGWQLDKIMEYELSPPAGDYSKAVLVSHKEEAPGKYTGSHIKVRDASYSQPPHFVTLFGESGVDNQDVIDAFNGGAGVVAYRGHGSTTTWSKWNNFGESLHKNDIGPSMVSPMNPVVWAITCTNSNIRWSEDTDDDCINEVWMEASEGGVAAYGATQTTSTTPNHKLNEELFRMVFDKGITTHAKAIELAEQSIWATWPGHKNPWAYMLLGDPSMTIRRGLVLNLGLLNVPSKIILGQQGPQGEQFLSLKGTTVADGFNDDGLVSAYKASFLAGAPDEVLGAWWLDGLGNVSVPVPITTPGTLYLTIRDGNGNMTRKEVVVEMGTAWKDLGKGMNGEFGKPTLVGVGDLVGGQPWSLLMTDARPGAPTFLGISTGILNLEFLGGLLIPDVATAGVIVPLSIDEYGDCVFGGNWVAGVPSGAKFYFQHWVLDASGPFGVVSSNGLRATAP
ncbi:C25 family cysteine peptidase [Engelhardtia mirabilis]|uniref:Gingipain R2 n=1 Tax=Engelhardtia mirabilis TaxID=2528011 RepID=A0A518BGK2_9BACT|nr:Gingipain R2 precursor [Planctomycetes bacterium Pla133]QDV00444.1 Gingipain R2 precursor [Planctomycetes bacterium Pla86]